MNLASLSESVFSNLQFGDSFVFLSDAGLVNVIKVVLLELTKHYQLFDPVSTDVEDFDLF